MARRLQKTGGKTPKHDSTSRSLRDFANAWLAYLRDKKHKSLRSGLLISIALHTAVLALLALIVIHNLQTKDELLITSRLDSDGLEEFVDTPFEVAIETQSKFDDPTVPKFNNVMNRGDVEIPNRELNPLVNPRTANPSGQRLGGLDLAATIGTSQRRAGTATQGELGEFKKRLTKAGAKTGGVQVSLIWNNGNDLDLCVRCPSGELIWFKHKQSQCGGVLDVDMNANQVLSWTPVENVYWQKDRAPKGQYQVFVHHFANNGFRDPTPFQVAVKTNDRTKTFGGVVSFGQPRILVHQFHDPPTPAQAAKDMAKQQRDNRAAQELLSKARSYLNSRNIMVPRLKKIIERFPDTEAANEARKILDALPR